jgi:hypothetical protein
MIHFLSNFETKFDIAFVYSVLTSASRLTRQSGRSCGPLAVAHEL